MCIKEACRFPASLSLLSITFLLAALVFDSSSTYSKDLSQQVTSYKDQDKVVAKNAIDKKLWFKFKGKPKFILGTNFPWYNGYRSLDFGTLKGTRTISTVASIDGKDLQSPAEAILPGATGFDAEGIEAQLADMEKMQIHVLRWFFGGDGRSFMNFDNDGNCTGIDESTLKNVETALAAAKRHHVYVTPCLLDFRFISGDKFVRFADGKPAPYLANVIRDPAKRHQLIDKFIKPLAAKFADEDIILYWEVMNECANVVNGTDSVTGFSLHGGERRARDKSVSPEQMQSFLNEAYDAIKSVDKHHPVMPSGLARPGQLPLIIGRVKADLYGAHYNDNGSEFREIKSIDELNQDLKQYKITIDKPLIMTEGSSTLRTKMDEYIRAAYNGGWAGVLPWQYYKTVGLNDFIRYKKHVTSADGNPNSKGNIEFYKQFAKEHKNDVSLD